MCEMLPKRKINIFTKFINLMLAVYLSSSCTAITHPSIDSDVKPYVSESYSFSNIDEVLVYSDFYLSGKGFGKYMNDGLEKEFSMRGVVPHMYAAQSTMNNELAFQKAKSINVNYVLILKDVREDVRTVRVGLYESETRKPLLQCIVKDSGFNWISQRETYNRLIQAIINNLDYKK